MDKTASGVLARMKATTPARYDTSVGSYFHDVLAPVSIEFENAYRHLEETFLRLLPATAEDEDLDIALGQLGFTRKGATYAEGKVTITGATDAMIKAGSLVGAGKNVYEVLETASLVEGSVTVPIRAKAKGVAANVPIGAINYFPVTLPKITSVTNTTAITGGADKETDKEYFARYLYFLEYPITSNNMYQYEAWALEIDEVGYARCIPTASGGGTVKLQIAKRDMQKADAVLCSQVKYYIEAKRLIGVELTVESAPVASLSVFATLVLDGSYTLVEVQEKYAASLDAYLKETRFAGVVPYSEIGAILQNTPGVAYYNPETLKINDAVGNFVLDEGELVVLGGVTLAEG